MAQKQADLTELLFKQMEYLQDRELSGEKLNEEISRSKAVAEVAGQIIANGALILNACRVSETASRAVKLPLLLAED
jgi:hypothetical protein